jgi:lactose/L-arabinose transport system permease protein
MFNYWRLQYKAAPYLYIAPFFILFAVFMLYPFVYSIYLSFVEWNGGGEKIFIGLDNYTRLFSDKVFWQSLWNGVIIFFLYVPLMLVMSLFLAILLNKEWMKAKGIFRTAFFTPNIMAVVAISFVFVILLNTQDGFFNAILLNLGLIKEPIGWLDTPFWARVSVALMVLYRWVGYNMILILAGLQNIPKELYDAAKVDGANSFQSLWYITLPLLKKIMAFCTILSTVGTYSLFTEPFILTGGGPLNSTITPVLLIYRESFQNLNFGYASSIAVMFFVLMMIFTLLQLSVFKEKE